MRVLLRKDKTVFAVSVTCLKSPEGISFLSHGFTVTPLLSNAAKLQPRIQENEIRHMRKIRGRRGNADSHVAHCRVWSGGLSDEATAVSQV